MAFPTLTQPQQSPAALPGTWKLGAGRAMTLLPREDGALRVAHGRVWATYDGPHRGPRNDLGDHVIGAGGRLQVRAGQRLVVEPWDGREAAYFTWEPQAMATAAQASPRHAAIVQPLADLRLAMTLGAGAAARLAVALVRLALGPLLRSRCTRADCAAG